MRPFLLIISLALLVPLAGCRDTLTDPLSEPPPAADAPPTLYLKGPDTIGLYQPREYRAQPIEAASYRWSVLVSGTAEVTLSAPTDRITTLTATRPGRVLLSVRAYDADGHVLAQHEREILATTS